MPEDMGAPNGYRTTDRCAVDALKYVGDRVPFVVAETAAQALDVLEHARVRLLSGMSQSAFPIQLRTRFARNEYSGR
jgi:hypothetical protein